MIRLSNHTLKFATHAKRQKLDLIFAEYTRVVNFFIKLYWEEDPRGIPRRANSSVYRKAESWMPGKTRACAANQALKILRSVIKRDKDKIYRVYSRVYSKAKARKRNIHGILSERWREWSRGKALRHRIRMPIFKGDSIDLNSGIVRIQCAKKSSDFDLWIRLGSILGNRESLILPTKHHKHSRYLENTGWGLKSSVCLRRDRIGKYSVNVFWEKEEQRTNQTRRALGVDVGINKMMTTSNAEQLGTDLRYKLNKINRRKQNSRNWNQTRAEIKNYIGYVTNRFPWDIDVVVMENIVNITKNTKTRVSKTTRKLFHNWNIDLLYRRMSEKANQNRVFLAFVEPAYSSQTCSSCGVIDKRSRNGEVFKCTACGHADDADHNASINILQRFLDGHFTVARGTKRT